MSLNENIRKLQPIFERHKRNKNRFFNEGRRALSGMTDKKRDRLLKSFFKHQEFNQVNQKYNSGKDGFRINDYIGRWYMDELILNVGKKRFYLLVCVEIFTKYCLVEINTRPSRAQDVKRIIDKIKNIVF